MRHLALAASAAAFSALTACQGTPDQTAVLPGDLPAISPDYRTKIITWARGFYAEPHGLRSTAITDPKLIRDRTGRLLWLVCIEADARARGDGYMGLQRQAFGFAPNYFSAPLERAKAAIVRQDCDDPALVWHPWPELARL